MLNSPYQLPNCVKRAETNFVLVVFDGVLHKVRAYTVIDSNRS